MARELGPKRNNGAGITKIIEFELWNNRTFKDGIQKISELE